MKIEKLDGINIGRIKAFPFPSDFANDSMAYDPVKTRLLEAETEEPANHKARNGCSASDFIDLIFTRSYRSALLVTTLTMNPSLVKHVLVVFQTAHDIKHGSKSRFLESKTIDNNKV